MTCHQLNRRFNTMPDTRVWMNLAGPWKYAWAAWVLLIPVLLSIPLTAVAQTVTTGAEAVVIIPDRNFRAVIEDSLGKSAGAPIIAAEMAKLTSLTAQHKNISDLTGLECATNLTRLYLRGNAISDISHLMGLTELSYLELSDNAISDLVSLIKNTGLGRGDLIDVRGNPLSYPSLNTYNPMLTSRGVGIFYDKRTPATLAKVSGDNPHQEGPMGTALANPFVVEVKDGATPPALFEGVPVIFAVTTGSGSLNVTTATTDANGRAQTMLTLGPTAGINTVTASVTEITQGVIFSANCIPPGVRVTPPALDLTEGGAVGSYTVVLTTQPTGQVMVGVASGDGSAVTVAPSSLTFTPDNWQTAQPVTVTAIEDADTADETVALTHAVDADSSANEYDDVSIAGMSVTVTDNDAVVNIPDASLRGKVEAALDKSGGEAITRAEMATLDTLIAQPRRISDLTGLEYATNLTYLYLGGNDISDISHLSSLTRLTVLWLQSNDISDISGLSGSTSLTELYLGDNDISDISHLSSLTRLTHLELYNNDVSDISGLSGSTSLTELHLGGNDISDISGLSGSTNLTWLHLGRNDISDISALSNLTDLTWLEISNNEISDISDLSGSTSLTELYLGDNDISDISAFVQLNPFDNAVALRQRNFKYICFVGFNQSDNAVSLRQ